MGAAEAVRIRGLDGVAYLDNTDANREKRQEGDIVFTAQTDRAYVETTHAVEIADPVLRRRIRLEKEDSRTTVVWNPWSTGAQSMADLGDDEWRTMACVEASNIRAFAVDLAPGQQHTMKTVIQVSVLGLVAVAIERFNQRSFPAASGKHVRLLAGRKPHVRGVQFLGGGQSKDAQTLAQKSPGGKGKDLVRFFDQGRLKNQHDPGCARELPRSDFGLMMAVYSAAGILVAVLGHGSAPARGIGGRRPSNEIRPLQYT